MIGQIVAYRPAIFLGLSQILGYGTLMYAYAILLPRMAEDLGLTLSAVFGILSLGLFFGGMASPLAGTLVDRFGGRWVMTFGALVAGLALMGFAWVEGRIGLFALVLVAEMAGMFVLYNVAFASVARLDGPMRPARASRSSRCSAAWPQRSFGPSHSHWTPNSAGKPPGSCWGPSCWSWLCR